MPHETIASLTEDTGLHTSPAGQQPEVYRRFLTTVNHFVGRRDRSRGAPLALLLGLAALTLPGCATTPAPLPAEFPIAVRYDVEPAYVGGSSTVAINRIEDDLREIAGLGFDHVVFCHVDDQARILLLRIARQYGLSAAVPDRALRHFIQTGELPPTCHSPEELAETVSKAVTSEPAFWTLAVSPGRGRDAKQRSQAVRQILEKQGTPCIAADLICLTADLGTIGPHDSPTEQWLARLHRELTLSRSGGLLVDRYRGLSGSPRGLVGENGLPTVSTRAAVAQVCNRVRHWGSRLRGLRPEDVPLADTGAGEAVATAFASERRRYVLLFNPSRTDYLRRRLVLPDMIDGRPVRRAVEVPPSTDGGPGRVFNVSPGRLPVTVDLRPGDAALFEIF